MVAHHWTHTKGLHWSWHRAMYPDKKDHYFLQSRDCLGRDTMDQCIGSFGQHHLQLYVEGHWSSTLSYSSPGAGGRRKETETETISVHVIHKGRSWEARRVDLWRFEKSLSPCCKARSPLGLKHMTLLGRAPVVQYKETVYWIAWGWTHRKLSQALYLFVLFFKGISMLQSPTSGIFWNQMAAWLILAIHWQVG